MRCIYRGYYAKDIGRMCVVFFGAWVGTSWECADDAHRKLGPWQHQQRVFGVIDIGTFEVLS